MPFLVRLHHLLNDLFDVLIGGLNCPIHLRMIWRRIVILDLEIFTQIFHHLIVEVRLIVCDDLIEDSIPAYDFLLRKSGHHLLCDICI